MNKRFPVLSSISRLLRVIGWVGIVGGFAYATYEGIYEPFLPNHGFGNEDAVQLVGGLAFGVFALIGVAFGEIIGVLFAIEENTRSKLDN